MVVGLEIKVRKEMRGENGEAEIMYQLTAKKCTNVPINSRQ